jgi:hypothetical protein
MEIAVMSDEVNSAHCHRNPAKDIAANGKLANCVIIFVAAVCVGALAWFASAKASGVFEPYDSSIGIFVNQAVLVTAAIWTGLRGRLLFVLAFLAGAYLGLNAYPYLFGSSESRAWATLGAVVNASLVIVPSVCSFIALACRTIVGRRIKEVELRD